MSTLLFALRVGVGPAKETFVIHEQASSPGQAPQLSDSHSTTAERKYTRDRRQRASTKRRQSVVCMQFCKFQLT